ncbi:MAG: adenylosuccinate lyase, partial [candidate division Zixibacteria bacterium]|nr:adenylosuccinate lyase [candidate division Zixibacteria bacterium]
MSLRSISPLDGRYAGQVQTLADYFSEWALIKYRIHVETEWLIMMSERPEIRHVRPFTDEECALLRSFVIEFDDTQAERVKTIEQTTRHDVKAVEYYIKERLQDTTLESLQESVHFCCTSEDVNNLAYALMLR